MTVALKQKSNYFYAVINYKDGTKYKQKWVSLGLPVKNNKRKAEAFLESVRQKYEDAYSTANGDMLFTTYVKRWLQAKKPLIELSTWEGYQIYAEKHIIPYFEPLKLTLREVKPQHIKDYYNYKYTAGRLDNKPGGLSIPSIKKHSIILKEVLNDAMVEDLVMRNVASGVKLPAKDNTQKKYVFLGENEANNLLNSLAGHNLCVLVYVTLYYALRRSEVLGLRWSAVDFEHGTITINHTVVKNKTIIEKDTTKSQSSYHTYMLINDVREALKRQKEWQNENRKIFGKSYVESDYIFTWEDGTLFRPDYVTRGFQRAIMKKGIPKMRFHDLRHSTASILYDKGWDLKDIQSWLRHSSVDVTGDIYTHISEERKAKMAEQLESTFSIANKSEATSNE